MIALPFGVALVLLAVPALLDRWERGRIHWSRRKRGGVGTGYVLSFGLLLSFVGWLFALWVGRGHALAIAPLCVIGILLFPWMVTRSVLVPLGLDGAAFHMAALAGWVWRGDVRAGQIVAGAWALSRRRAPSRARLARLEAARDELPHLSAAGVLGSGLLAAAKGDRDTARRLIGIVGAFDETGHASLARRIARRWLVGDAATLGDWNRVEALARTPGARSPAVALLGAIAARVRRIDPIPSDLELRLRAWMCPGSGDWLRAALRVSKAGGRHKTPAPRPGDDPIVQAQRLCAAAERAARLGDQGRATGLLVRGARAWQEVLSDSDQQRRTSKRALALRASPDRARAALREHATRSLARLVDLADVPVRVLESAGGLLGEVAKSRRHSLLDSLALQCERITARIESDRAHGRLDELQEWAALRERWEQTRHLADEATARLAFAEVHDASTRFARWLCERRGELPLGTAIFSWLVHEAALIDDERAFWSSRTDLAAAA